MKKKTFFSLLIFAMLFAISCESEYEPQPDPEIKPENEFCSHLGLEDIREAIPLINNFLTEALAHIECDTGGAYMEEIFKILAAGLNSLLCDVCNVNARVLYRISLLDGQEWAVGVGLPIMDNGVIRELRVEFATIEATNGSLIGNFTQIEGFVYSKQDRIHVATSINAIDRVFDLINSLDFDALTISGGVLVSPMPPNKLQYILESLNSRPYTQNGNTWQRTHGYVSALTGQITIFPILFNMHNKDYQADWIKTMANYQLREEDDTGHTITFRIPEGTGREWEARFRQYDFVRWAEQSGSTHFIR